MLFKEFDLRHTKRREFDSDLRLQSCLRSRRKRGSGRGARTREKNGGLGARDEGTPATKTPIFSSPPTNFQVIQLS